MPVKRIIPIILAAALACGCVTTDQMRRERATFAAQIAKGVRQGADACRTNMQAALDADGRRALSTVQSQHVAALSALADANLLTPANALKAAANWNRDREAVITKLYARAEADSTTLRGLENSAKGVEALERAIEDVETIQRNLMIDVAKSGLAQAVEQRLGNGTLDPALAAIVRALIADAGLASVAEVPGTSPAAPPPIKTP